MFFKNDPDWSFPGYFTVKHIIIGSLHVITVVCVVSVKQGSFTLLFCDQPLFTTDRGYIIVLSVDLIDVWCLHVGSTSVVNKSIKPDLASSLESKWVNVIISYDLFLVFLMNLQGKKNFVLERYFGNRCCKLFCSQFDWSLFGFSFAQVMSVGNICTLAPCVPVPHIKTLLSCCFESQSKLPANLTVLVMMVYYSCVA